MNLIEKLKALRSERSHLVSEQSLPITSNPYGGFINAKYARAVRIQQIDRELEARKREAFKLIYGGRL